MKKIVIALLLGCIVFFVACGKRQTKTEAKTTTSTTITKPKTPTTTEKKVNKNILIVSEAYKLQYNVNEAFDASGLTAKLIYANNTKSELKGLNELTVEVPNMTTPGTKQVVVSYLDNDIEYSNAYYINVQQLSYVFENEAYKVSGSAGEVKKIVIPSTYKDGENGEHSVISINAYAFSGDNVVEEIVLPNTIETIGNCAFSSCSSLKKIKIPENVKIIGQSAFSSTAITSVSIPKSVVTIDAYAFQDCGELMDLTISNEPLTIRSGAFDGCTSLASVKYLGTMKEWCKISFADAYANPLLYGKKLYLNEVLVDIIEIETGTTDIFSFTFVGCDAIGIVIPSSVIRISESAFIESEKMETIYLQSNYVAEEYMVNNTYWALAKNVKKIYIKTDVSTISQYVKNNYTLSQNISVIKEVSYYEYSLNK